MSWKDKKEVKCFKCNEVEHFKQDCPLWKKKQGKGSGSNSLSVVADLKMEDDLLVVLDGRRSNTKVWTLDSAYSYHYTSN